ncbi:lipocalin-like domain-containing protein [Photobacterium leiognathi]|uniref:lipocalin family protein n=1 Tax=Photobacterium leiognathi TaxID=553611 RepID=UPI00298255D4|nr:lipocalin family protein [Photobacterium leiognathi]
MQFKLSLVAASLLATLTLTGCNDDSSTTTAPETKTITAIDGYLVSAKVSVDTNNDNQCDKELGKTIANGKFDLPKQYESNKLCIDAIAKETQDEDRGLVVKEFSLHAPAGSDVVTPLTNLVAQSMAKDSDLSLEDAQTKVIETLNNGGLSISKEDAFGDYVANKNNEGKALVSSQLLVIAESLTDHNDKTLEQQLTITQELSNEVQNKTVEELNDFAPTITVDSETGTVTVKPNQRPQIVDNASIKSQTIKQGESIAPIALTNLFSDDTSAEIKYSLESINASINTLSIQNNEIVGSINVAGTFSFQVFATDEDNARSKPITFNVTVEGNEQPEPEPQPNFEGQTWYMIEDGYSNGTNETSYPQTWCDSIRLENGIVYYNQRSDKNRNSCSEANEESGTYTVKDNTFTLSFTEDGETETLTLNVVNQKVKLENTEIVTLSEEDNTERYTYFENKADAEKRLNVKSDGAANVRDIPTVLPTMSDAMYQLGSYSVQMYQDGETNKVKLWLDSQNGFSCKDAEEFYQYFVLTSSTFGNEGRVYSKEPNSDKFMCADVTEENNISTAVIDFTIPFALKVNENYSLIGSVYHLDKEALESVKLNLIWTGQSNND